MNKQSEELRAAALRFLSSEYDPRLDRAKTPLLARMRWRIVLWWRSLFLAVLFAWLAAGSLCFADTAFLAAPRTGSGLFRTQSVSEINGPYAFHANADLLIRRDDGSEVVALKGNALDFTTSLDGKSLWATQVVNSKTTRIVRIDAATLAVTEILAPREGEWVCQPVETSEGLCYLSNIDGWKNPHETYRALTIYGCTLDGKHRHRIWHAGLGGVFGLSYGKDGYLRFGSGENQGTRIGGGTLWSTWKIRPDGSGFEPVFSLVGVQQFAESPYDWPCQSSTGAEVAAKYYDTRVYGRIDVGPPHVPSAFSAPTPHDNPLISKVPNILNGFRDGGRATQRIGHQWRGVFNLTPYMHDDDIEAKNSSRNHVGHVSHPAPIPGNGIYCTWTGNKGDGVSDLDVVAIPDVSKATVSPNEFVKIVATTARHEWMGRPIVSYRDIYGHDPPAVVCPMAKELPAGSPFTVVGSSSVDQMERAVNMVAWPEDSRLIQPAPDTIEYLRIWLFNPTTMRNVADRVNNPIPGRGEEHWNTEGFVSPMNERALVGLDVPLSKWTTPEGAIAYGPVAPQGSTLIRRTDGRRDTSFRAEIPANAPYTFAMLDKDKNIIGGTFAETWHQGVPGEDRTNCAGCHNHWKPDSYGFENTFAAKPDYKRFRTTLAEVRTDLPGMFSLKPGTKGGKLITEADKLGPWADEVEPTVNVVPLATELRIGMLDAQAGLDMATFAVSLGGKDVTSEFIADPAEHIWTRPGKPAGELSVRIRDTQGNETVHTETIAGTLPPPDPDPDPDPPPVDPCAAYKARIAELEAQLALTEAERDELAALKASIHEMTK